MKGARGLKFSLTIATNDCRCVQLAMQCSGIFKTIFLFDLFSAICCLSVPQVAGKTVKLRREIGLKKDTYYLNGKQQKRVRLACRLGTLAAVAKILNVTGKRIAGPKLRSHGILAFVFRARSTICLKVPDFLAPTRTTLSSKAKCKHWCK